MRYAAVAVLAALVAFGCRAGETKPAVVSHVKVVSDKVEDVSSLEAWKSSFIKDGMSDEEKAIAVWKSVATFQHQETPPVEYLHHEDAVYDPIKLFNVYGYAMCSPASAHISALARYVGLQARGWAINHHSVPEVYFDGAWHLMDASLINFFRKPDGKIAGVEELIAGVKEWMAKNPEFQNLKDKELDAKLYKFMKEMPQGWKSGPKGWIRGPEILRNPWHSQENGWHPAKTHGWSSTMREYDGSVAFRYEYLPTPGYEVNIQLRKGERITRNWSNKGLHVNMEGGGGKPGCLTVKTLDDFPHWKQLGNLAPGRVGNGTHEYDLPLASGEFKPAALQFENLACKADDNGGPAVHVKDAGQPGVLVIRMPSSYVYLSGQLTGKAVVGNGGEILIELSDNHGLSWKEVAKISATSDQTIDLKSKVYRRYDYRLRFTLKGKDTGLDALKLTHDIQHSQRALPAFDKGDNKVSFSTGAQEGTITLDGNFHEHAGKQRSTSELAPEQTNFKNGRLTGPEGSVTFTVNSPGDITRIRMSAGARNWGLVPWEFQVSFDEGKTFKKIGEIPAINFGCSHYAVCSEVPAGTRKALVRYAGKRTADTILAAFRIDADYQEPNSGFRPIKVVYTWEENGQEKRDERIVKQAAESWTVSCAEKPTMKSLVLEWAE